MRVRSCSRETESSLGFLFQMENKSFSTSGFNLCFLSCVLGITVLYATKEKSWILLFNSRCCKFALRSREIHAKFQWHYFEENSTFALLIPLVLGLEYSDFLWNCYYFIKYAYGCACTNVHYTHHTIILPSKHFGYRCCIILIFSNFQLSVLHRVKSCNVKFIHDYVIFRYLVLFSCKCWLNWPQAHYQHSPNLTIRVHPSTGHGAAVSDEPKQFSFRYVFYFYCWLNVHKLITYMKEFKWNGLFIAAIPVGFSLHFM